MPNLNIDPNAHYVKFMRGSIQAWEALKQTPERISDDTLYFIYQDAQTSREGKLYLGQKLISGIGNGGIAEDINITDLGDVYIDGEELEDKQILVYNETNQQWENTSLSTIIDTAVGVMQGATATTAGSAGLVPAPQIGDQTKFLKGNGTWAIIDIPSFDSSVFETNLNDEITLAGIVQAPVGSIPIKTNNGLEWANSITGSLTRSIISMEDLEDALENNTYREDVIYMVANDNSDDDTNSYDEYLVIDSKLERIGTFGNVDLANYVKNSTFQTLVTNLNQVLYDTTNAQTGISTVGLITKVGNLETMQAQIGNLSNLTLTDGNTTLVQQVNTITDSVVSLSERLKWQELNE